MQLKKFYSIANEMAKGQSYFNLAGINISEDNKWVAFGIDLVSRRQYTIQIKNLETGEILPVKIENTTGGSTWASDNKTLFYTRKDAQTLRSDKIYKHKVGTNPSDDQLIFHEKTTHFQLSYTKKNQKVHCYWIIKYVNFRISNFRID